MYSPNKESDDPTLKLKLRTFVYLSMDNGRLAWFCQLLSAIWAHAGDTDEWLVIGPLAATSSLHWEYSAGVSDVGPALK